MENSTIQNITYDEIYPGQTVEMVRNLTKKDIALFGYMSGDVNPAHFDKEYAKDTIFKDVIAHGMWSGSLISAVLGTQLPGPGTIYLNQNLKFAGPIYVGDQITVKVTVLEKKEKNKVVLECKCINQDNKVVTMGTAEVIAPTKKITANAIKINPSELINEL